MSIQIVRFNADPQHIPDVEEAIGRVFGAIRKAAPTDIEYTATRLGDSTEFLLALRLPAGAPNPLLEIPEAGAFRDDIAKWAGGPVAPVTLHVLGRYAA